MFRKKIKNGWNDLSKEKEKKKWKVKGGSD